MFSPFESTMSKALFCVTLLLLAALPTIASNTSQTVGAYMDCDCWLQTDSPVYRQPGEIAAYTFKTENNRWKGDFRVYIHDVLIKHDDNSTYHPFSDHIYFLYKGSRKQCVKPGRYPNTETFDLKVNVPSAASVGAEIVVTIHMGERPHNTWTDEHVATVSARVFSGGYPAYPGSWPVFNDVPEIIEETWNTKTWNEITDASAPPVFNVSLTDPWYGYFGGSNTPYDQYTTYYFWMGENTYDSYDNEWEHTPGLLHARIPLEAAFGDNVTITLTTYTSNYVKNPQTGQYYWTDPQPINTTTVTLTIQETHDPVFDTRPTIVNQYRTYGTFNCDNPVKTAQPGDTITYNLTCDLPTGVIDAAWHNYSGSFYDITFVPPANGPSGYAQPEWLENGETNQVEITVPSQNCSAHTFRVIISSEWRTSGGKPHNLGWFRLLLVLHVNGTGGPGQPGISVDKKVWNGTQWIDQLTTTTDTDVQFKITVTNNGTIDLPHVYVTDTLPGFLTYNYDADIAPSSASDHSIQWYLGTLPIGETVTIHFSAHADTIGNGDNTVTADSCAGVSDDDSVHIIVEEQPPSGNMTVEKLVRKQPCGDWQEQISADVGDTVRFKIQVCYQGDYTLYNIHVRDQLPPQLQYADNANPIETSVSPDNRTIWWNLSDDIQDGECISIEFDAEVVACGTAVNNVTVTADECSGQQLHGWDTAIVEIECDEGMTVEKRVKKKNDGSWYNQVNADVGDTVRFNITICYTGDYTLYNIHVRDQLPPQLQYANNASPQPSSISPDERTIWWNLSIELSDGECITILFDALVVDGGDAVNNVTVTANECSGDTFTMSDTAIVHAEGTPLEADAGGPYTGVTDENIVITGSASGGEQPYTYNWDLNDDGTYNDASGQSITHAWSTPGTYTISLQVTDNSSATATDNTTVTIEQANQPPNKPTLDGPTSGKTGEDYNYTVTTTDPENDEVYYWFDWDDNTTSGWLGPYTSGENINATHSWTEKGDYTIRVKAKDSNDAESQWATLQISMPKSSSFNSAVQTSTTNLQSSTSTTAHRLSPQLLPFISTHQTTG